MSHLHPDLVVSPGLKTDLYQAAQSCFRSAVRNRTRGMVE